MDKDLDQEMDYYTQLCLLPVYKEFVRFKNFYLRKSPMHKKALFNLLSFFYVILCCFFSQKKRRLFQSKKLSKFFLKAVFFFKKNLLLAYAKSIQNDLSFKKSSSFSYYKLFLNDKKERRKMLYLMLYHSCLKLIYQLPETIVSPTLTKRLTKKLLKKKHKQKGRLLMSDALIREQLYRHLPRRRRKGLLKRFEGERLKKKIIRRVRRKNVTELGIGRRKKRNQNVGFLYVHSTKRNFKTTFVDKKGTVLAYYSCGTNRKYRKARRRLKDARQKAMFRMTVEIYEMKYRRVITVFNQGYYEPLLRTLKRRRIRQVAQFYSNPKPHNGCRGPNKKRK